jgi:hypothetical protein
MMPFMMKAASMSTASSAVGRAPLPCCQSACQANAYCDISTIIAVATAIRSPGSRPPAAVT